MKSPISKVHMVSTRPFSLNRWSQNRFVILNGAKDLLFLAALRNRLLTLRALMNDRQQGTFLSPFL